MRTPSSRSNTPFYLFGLVLVLAFLIRVTGVERFPPGLWFDEGLNGVDAWRTIQDGQWRLVYPEVFPREPLMIWILSLVLGIGGPDVLIMRLTLIAVGSLACAAFFGMIRSLRRDVDPGPALAAAFVLCALHWHAWFSRLIFRTNLVPLLACLLVWMISLAARRRGRGAAGLFLWIFAGALAGLGFYTYLSWYFFTPVVLVWLWALRSRNEYEEDLEGDVAYLGRGRRQAIPLLCFFGAAVLVALPLFMHYAMAPQDIASRPQAVSPFANGYGEGLRLMLRNARDVALMFSIRGDHVPLHNVAEIVAPGDPRFGKTGSPILDPAWSVFFWAGLATTFWRVFRRRGDWRIDAAWLAWLFCMSLPSVVTQTDSANMLRNLGAVPAVAWLTASGFGFLREKAGRAPERFRVPLQALLLLALVWGGAFQAHKLMVRHPNVRGIADRFNAINVHLAQLTRPDPNGALLFVPEMFMNKTFEFLTLRRNDIRAFGPQSALGRPAEGPLVDHRVLCTNYDMNHAMLQRIFPNGRVEDERLLLGDQLFAWVFRIPAESLLPPEEAQRWAQSWPRPGVR